MSQLRQGAKPKAMREALMHCTRCMCEAGVLQCSAGATFGRIAQRVESVHIRVIGNRPEHPAPPADHGDHAMTVQMTAEQMLAMISQLQADNAKQAAALSAAQAPRRITYKVGEKGGISIYGLGRFPVTAYASQWERIIGDIDNLKAFMVTNAALLTRK